MTWSYEWPKKICGRLRETVEKSAKTAKKTQKPPKKRLKRENFIFLVSSKFSLYFFTPSDM